MSPAQRSAGAASLVAQLFKEATALHKGGRLPEAAQRYRAVLALAPEHAATLPLLGVVLAQQGQHAEAVELLGKALRLAPTSAELHNNLGMVLHAMKRYEAAADHYRQAIALNPRYAIAHNNLGNSLTSLGRREEAIASFETALTIHPTYPEALSNLGVAFYESNRPEEAVACLEKAVALRSDFADAEMNLGNALSTVGRSTDAVRHLERALAIRPDHAEAETNLGRVLVELRRLDEAMVHLNRALSLNPDLPEAHVNLGNALTAGERHAEALPCFEKALQLRPGFAAAEIGWGVALLGLRRRIEALARFERAVALQPGSADAEMHLGVGLSVLDRNEDAIVRFEHALRLRPNFAEAELNLGKALLSENRQEEAITHFEKALGLKPGLEEAQESLGGALQELGRVAEACAVFEHVLAGNPRRTQAHLYLANAMTAAPGDSRLAALEALAQDMPSFSTAEQVQLHFALAKSLADAGAHDRSFQHYLQGNALARRQSGYDEAASQLHLERIQAAFTPDLMARLRGLGDPSRAPIFIVGMPRSGSTLVEQMLASHPRVFAGGERLDFRRVLQQHGLDHRMHRFSEGVAALDGARLRALGESYLQRVQATCSAAAARSGGSGAAAERTTDKLLANFLYCGLIHLALPNARIIHTCRDPIDTCLSCFSTLFFGDQPHTYDLGEIGRYYRGYAVLMDHWRQVLPAGVMLDVQYDAMVTDFEAQSRRILDHCGLDWDDRCLAFHETKRPVRTASVLQVRQPLYRSSLRRWRPDDATLRPLLSGLGMMRDAAPQPAASGEG